MEQRSLLAVDLDFAFGIGGTGQDGNYSAVTTDAAGNVIAAGVFVDTVDFDPGPGTTNLTATGGPSAYIAKYSPTGALIWARATSGGSMDARTVAVDSASNVFVGGSFSGPADFDPGVRAEVLTHTGAGDAYLLKLDSAGNFVWVRQISGGRAKGILAVDVDPAGNVYAGGSFDGTVDLDPGPGETLVSGGTTDPCCYSNAFVVKLDGNGIYQWGGAFTGPTASYSAVYGLALDAAGNVLTTGTMQGTIDFDPGAATQALTSAGSDDVFVSKLDANGNFAWVRRMGGTGSDNGQSLDADGAGNVYIGGVFNGTADFDPGPGSLPLTSAGGQDAFVTKLDSSGNLVWAQRMGGSGGDSTSAVSAAVSGSVYATGSFAGTVDFDQGLGTYELTSAGEADVFVLRLDASGGFVAAIGAGGSAEEASHSLALDPAGDIVIGGHFLSSTADFDPGPGTFNITNAGSYDAFVAKFRQSIRTIDDACNCGTALLITGTAAADEIVVGPGSTAQTLSVTINGVTNTATRPSGRIIVIGDSGDDDIQIAGSVTNAAWLYGDAGDDRLKGGAGDDVLLGGADDDLLVGGSGRDMLIGGTEADRIVGNADDDILIAGSTSFDALEAALCAIMDEWTSQRTYAQRRLNLLGSTTGGANGAHYLQADVTVFNDAAADVLTGSSGQDWFFANLDSLVKDKITDLSASEFSMDLDFILGP